jgi:hypothetical protein
MSEAEANGGKSWTEMVGAMGKLERKVLKTFEFEARLKFSRSSHLQPDPEPSAQSNL